MRFWVLLVGLAAAVGCGERSMPVEPAGKATTDCSLAEILAGTCSDTADPTLDEVPAGYVAPVDSTVVADGDSTVTAVTDSTAAKEEDSTVSADADSTAAGDTGDGGGDLVAAEPVDESGSLGVSSQFNIDAVFRSQYSDDHCFSEVGGGHTFIDNWTSWDDYYRNCVPIPDDGGRPWTDADKEVIQRAIDRWEEVIVGDVPDTSVTYHYLGRLVLKHEGYTDPTFYVDDIRITFVAYDWDTFWGSNASAITFVTSDMFRSNHGPPFYGTVLSDIRSDNPYFYEVMLHEIGHVLGLVSDPISIPYGESPNVIPGFWVGAAGRRAFGNRNVPLALNSYGGNTTHWDGSAVGDELMADRWTYPYEKPLSVLSIAALEDLGYEVDYSKADPWEPPSGAAKPVASTVLRPHWCGGVVYEANRPIALSR